MDYRQAEQALLLGVLEALPCPTILVNGEGQAVYVGEKPCPVNLNRVDFASMTEVKKALREGKPVTERTALYDASGAAAEGFLEVYPFDADKSGLPGALCLFRPEPKWEDLQTASLPVVSEAMRHVWERLHTLASLSTPALIQGEAGLGIAELARALHDCGPRAGREFVSVGPGDGADRLRKAAARCGGSLCCEDIDGWPEDMLTEAAYLYIRRYLTLEGESIPLKARLIATAGVNLGERVRAGQFPAELYTRMNIMPLFVPPLRERPEDVLSAALHLAKGFAAAGTKEITGLSEEAAALLTRQEWRENYTELRIHIEEAVSHCPGGLLRAEDLGSLHRAAGGKSASSLRRMRSAYDRDHIRAMLDIYGYGLEGKRKTARELGISLSTLYRVLGSK